MMKLKNFIAYALEHLACVQLAYHYSHYKNILRTESDQNVHQKVHYLEIYQGVVQL